MIQAKNATSLIHIIAQCHKMVDATSHYLTSVNVKLRIPSNCP